MKLKKPTVKLPKQERYLTGRSVDLRTQRKLSRLTISNDDRKRR